MERIQKIISAWGIASRRQAEEMLKAGRITCNGAVAHLGQSADPDQDVLCLDGVPLKKTGKRVYLLLNKPRGYVTTLSDEKGRKNVSQLVSGCGTRVYPVGRLDMDSEGLLILTNDGDFANKLMHPRHIVDKVYLVEVEGYAEGALERLRSPIVLDGYQIRTPEVSCVSKDPLRGTARLRIVIHEGRNRQVRRMCAFAGMRVKRLKRIAEGNLQLGDLPTGAWRYLSEEEVTGI